MIHDVHEVSTREVFRLTGPESLSTHYVMLSRVYAQAPIFHGTADDALRVSVRHDARGKALTDIFDWLSFQSLPQGVVALYAFLYFVESTGLAFVLIVACIADLRILANLSGLYDCIVIVRNHAVSLYSRVSRGISVSDTATARQS